jgi:hypothetical protein
MIDEPGRCPNFLNTCGKNTSAVERKIEIHILRQNCKCYACLFAKVVLESDEVKRGGNKDDSVCALHCGFEDHRQDLCREVLESLLGFVGRACAIKMKKILLNLEHRCL